MYLLHPIGCVICRVSIRTACFSPATALAARWRMLAAMSTRRFRAAAPISGNPDAFAFFHRYPRRHPLQRQESCAEFQMRSAVCYAHSFKCPVKVMHGSEEVNFDTRLALLSKRALAGGVKMELATVQGNHNSALPGEIEQSIQFFRSVAA